MRILTADIPPSMPSSLAAGAPIMSPQQAEEVMDDILDKLKERDRVLARSAWLALGKSGKDFDALFDEKNIEAGDAKGHRIRTIPHRMSPTDLMAAAHPSRPELPALNVTLLRSNMVEAIKQSKEMATNQQSNGQWFVWDIAKVTGATVKVKNHAVGTATERTEGVLAQRVIAPGSEMDEPMKADVITEVAVPVITYVVKVIDVTGREDTDHAGRPIVKIVQSDKSAEAIEKLAAVLAGQRAPASATPAASAAPLTDTERQRIEDDAAAKVLADIPPSLRAQVEQALARNRKK